MRNIFCWMCRAKNNEEYRAVLKKRAVRMYLFILAGILTAGIALYVNWLTELSEYRLGFLLGLGAGLVLGAAVQILKMRRLLRNEEKLKEARLRETDEREVEIDGLALRAASRVLLVALYLALFIGGLFARKEILFCSWVMLAVFLLSYMGFKKYYGARM